MISAAEHLWGIRKRITGSPYQLLRFPAFSSTRCRPENLLRSAESRTSEPAVLYAVDEEKEAQKAALKDFCFLPFLHYAVHSSDTARSWAKMLGVAISYSIRQLESFYVAFLI